MTKFHKLEDYEEVKIKCKEELLSFACCDCGLVHTQAFYIYKGGTIGMASVRNKRATAQLRRYKYGSLQQGFAKDKYKMEHK